MRATGKSFVMIKLPASSQRVLRELPLLVGSTSDSDLVINSAALAPVARVVAERAGRLTVVDIKTGRDLGPNSLSPFKVELEGPFGAEMAEGKSLKAKLMLFARKEQRLFARLPRGLRTLMLGNLRPAFRYLGWVAGAFALTALLEPETVVLQNLSSRPLPLTYGQVLQGPLPPPSEAASYSDGIILALELTDIPKDDSLRLELEAKDLDKDAELTIGLAGQELFRTSVSSACVDRYCPIGLELPTSLLKPGKNLIVLKHDKSASGYQIKNLLVVARMPLTPEQELMADRDIALAQRLYDDREIVITNLVEAQREIDKTLALLRAAKGRDDLRAKAHVLKISIEKDLQAKAADLTNRVKRAIQLNDLPQAEAAALQLLKLYPDEASPQNSFIRERLAKIRELKK